MNLTDEELTIAAGRGDMNAFEQIVVRHQQLAWRTAYRGVVQAQSKGITSPQCVAPNYA